MNNQNLNKIDKKDSRINEVIDEVYDLFLDLITPETGGIRLDLDQRVFLRGLGRFMRLYGTFPRGYG